MTMIELYLKRLASLLEDVGMLHGIAETVVDVLRPLLGRRRGAEHGEQQQSAQHKNFSHQCLLPFKNWHVPTPLRVDRIF